MAVGDMAQQDTVEEGTAAEDMLEQDMAGGTEAIEEDILVGTMVAATYSSASAIGLGITRRPITTTILTTIPIIHP